MRESQKVKLVNSADLEINPATEDTWYAIIGLKLKANYLGATIKILNVALQEQAGTKKCEWALFFNPTVASTFTYSDQSRSAVQVARGATANTVTNGYRITGGYFESGGVQSGNAGSADRGIDNALRLGSTIAGTSDEIVLCARPIGGSTDADIEGSITWRELL